MIKKTKDYGMFKMRPDNREKIDYGHVAKLAFSIKAKNLLEFRPIQVNADMEIIDGQHRLLAAQQCDVEIYYDQKQGLEIKDVIALNIQKSWNMADYLNYYCKNGYVEYQKFQNYMKQNRLSLSVTMRILFEKTRPSTEIFRAGEYVHNEKVRGDMLDKCHDTLGYIRKIKGSGLWHQSARFWKALIALIDHPEFDAVKWRHNLERKIDLIAPKATFQQYVKMLEEIYNWRNPSKIFLTEKPSKDDE
jgi:hypothetical protein